MSEATSTSMEVPPECLTQANYIQKKLELLRNENQSLKKESLELKAKFETTSTKFKAFEKQAREQFTVQQKRQDDLVKQANAERSQFLNQLSKKGIKVDDPSTSLSNLRSQLQSKDSEIAALKSRLKALESRTTTTTSSDTDARSHLRLLQQQLRMKQGSTSDSD